MEIVRYTELKNTKRHNLAEVIPLAKPYTLLIEPSSSCNFRCRMCFQSAAQEKFKDKRQTMDIALFRRIIEQAKAWGGERFKVLKLCIYGEPFTNPHFTEMLQMAHAAAITDRIETTSNASLLTEEICRGLVRGGLDYLRVSIYSAIPQKHLEITDSNVPMQRVHDNLRMLQRVKREMGTPSTRRKTRSFAMHMLMWQTKFTLMSRTVGWRLTGSSLLTVSMVRTWRRLSGR